jgi:single-stranded DNA-binding protein
MVEGGRGFFFLGVLATGKQADMLALHHKGDFVSVAGDMQMDQWMGPDGDMIRGYQVMADSVISARTVNGNERQLTGIDWLE